MNLPFEDLSNYIRNLDEEMIREIIMEGTNNQTLNFLIINLIARLEHDNITFSYEVMSRKELSQFNRKMSMLSVVYRDYSSFNSHMIRFRNHRAALIYKLSSSANELDRNSSRITVLKLFGYIVVVISSLNLGIYLGRALMISFLKIAPFLTLSVQKLLIAASCPGPMFFAVSYADYLRSRYILNCITDMIEEDKRLFAQISNSNLERNVIQFFSAELFSQTTHEEVIKNVKELASNENLTIKEKIFATVVISNMKYDPLCLKDIRFLYKTYLFSRTEAAAIWFNSFSW
ncbi:unnamed protein product [Larinioides sclopetarius]|uniref:Odorant receptor n=1 Tax=Larinioides sclopetarius TaxID=280406 RepID=A0AAV1YVG4_9ARAC